MTQKQFEEPPFPLFRPGEIEDEFPGIGIYGRTDSGKTTLLGTMPGRGLVIDIPQVEGGTKVLALSADRIRVYRVADWDAIDEVYWYFHRGKHPFDWLAFDSISGMEELAKRKTVRERDFKADPKTLELRDYGKMGELIAELVYKFRKLPIPTIWTAQERTVKGDDGDMFAPDLIPSALSSFLPSLSVVGRMRIVYTLAGEAERRLYVGPSPTWYTKTRAVPTLAIPEFIRNPDLGQLLDYLDGKEVELDTGSSSGEIVL